MEIRKKDYTFNVCRVRELIWGSLKVKKRFRCHFFFLSSHIEISYPENE